jgi:hypothetical protein
LPYFHQLNAKVMHCLKGTKKLGLVAKDTDQNRSVRSLLDVQVQSLECGNECISQLTAYADLIGEALSASGHDGVVAAWPLLARALIAMDMSPPHVDSGSNDRITAHCS